MSLRRRLGKLARMDAAEIGSRSLAAGSAAVDRMRAMVKQPQWRTEDFVRVLARDPSLVQIRDAAAAGRWTDAHRRLSRQIADRELAVIRSRLGWDGDELEVVLLSEGMAGPGNVVLLSIESEHVVEVFTGFGEIGVRAEAVAERVAQEARRYLAADVPVGPHLADQLLLPMALAGGGAFRTVPLSRHASTNVEVIGQFLGTTIDVTPVGDTAVDVIVRA